MKEIVKELTTKNEEGFDRFVYLCVFATILSIDVYPQPSGLLICINNYLVYYSCESAILSTRVDPQLDDLYIVQ